MKIAQVAPLAEAVPPKLYGGTERVVAYLTDALVELGHEVTLFASGDSVTKATLAPIWPRALRLDPNVKDHFAPLFMQLETVARRAHEFDVIHCSSRLLRLSVAAAARHPVDHHPARPARSARAAGALRAVRRYSGGLHLRFPARAAAGGQLRGDRAARPAAESAGKGFGPAAGISPFSGASRRRRRRMRRFASRRKAGMPLKIAAKVDRVDREYFKTHHRAAALARRCRVHRRDPRGPEARISGQCCRAPVSRSRGASRSGW